MCLCLYPADQARKGTHLSIFLYLMKGPHNDELTCPLRETFEVKLLNQISIIQRLWPIVQQIKVLQELLILSGLVLVRENSSSFPMKTSATSLPHVSISKMIVSSSKLANYRYILKLQSTQYIFS